MRFANRKLKIAWSTKYKKLPIRKRNWQLLKLIFVTSSPARPESSPGWTEFVYVFVKIEKGFWLDTYQATVVLLVHHHVGDIDEVLLAIHKLKVSKTGKIASGRNLNAKN